MKNTTASGSALNYIMKGVVFLLLVGSLAQSIVASLYLPVPFISVLGMTAAAYIILSLYLYNRYAAAVLFPLTAAFLGIYIYYLASEEWLVDILEWLEWLLDYTLGATFLQSQYSYPSAWLIVFALSLIIYIFIVKTEWFLVPLIFSIGVIGTEWALGHIHILPYLWPFALAWLLLLSSKYHKRLSRLHSMPNYGVWQVSVIPLAVAVVLTSYIILPRNTQKLKWEYLERKVNDITERWTDWSVFSSPRKPFRLSYTGFPSSSNELGGPIKISDDVVLKITSSAPLYLRGSQLNEYTGNSWIDTIDDHRYKLKSSYSNKARNKAFDWDEPIWRDTNHELQERFFNIVKASVTHIGIETSVIFNSQRLEDIDVQKWGGFVAYFNGKGETFTSRDISSSESYLLHVRIPNTADQMFRDFINEYVPIIDWRRPIAETWQGEDMDREKLLHVQKYYTALPESLPQRVIDLADFIVIGSETPLDKALAIQSYLMENYSYTIYPPETPGGVDFVDYFLFELKKGYCTYFATAMAVLGRAAGLPTRYVEGFLMPSQPVEGNVYEVKKLNGHAWVEVYFPKVGWLTFDPTPAEQSQHGTVEQQNTGMNEDPYLEEYMDYLQDYQEEAGYIPDHLDSSETQDTLSPWSGILQTLLILLILLGLTAIILGGVKLWDILRWHRIKKLPYERQLSYCYQEILWLLKLYGFPIKRGETPYAYAQRVDSWLINPAGSMYQICHLIIKNQFGGYHLTEHDMDRIRYFYRNLENNIKSLLGFYPYIFKLVLRRTGLTKRLKHT